jgi:hypothetical protein
MEGLLKYDNFLTEAEEQELIDFVNAQEWDTTLRRRVQHYGARYQYRYAAASSSPVPPVPEKFDALAHRVYVLFGLEVPPNVRW